MTVTADMITRLRRMINEPTETTYSDEDLEDVITRNAAIDERGLSPWVLEYSTTPPTRVENEAWIPTYDLNAAAADVWEEKAALEVARFDFQADGGNYKRSQRYTQAVDMEARYRSRSMIKSVEVKKHPKEINDVYIK